jgi:hypothetical protein
MRARFYPWPSAFGGFSRRVVRKLSAQRIFCYISDGMLPLDVASPIAIDFWSLAESVV